MRSRRNVCGRAQSEVLILAVVMGAILIYFMHRMAVTAQARQYVAVALKEAKSVEQAAMNYKDENREWPESIYDMHLEPHATAHGAAFTTDFTDGQIIITFDPEQDRVAGKTLILKPTGSGSGWSCVDGTVDLDYRPKACLPYSL